MNESSARDALLIYAFETVEPRCSSWNEEDSAWASRQALFDKAAKGNLDGFIARRAKIALQRLAQNEPVITESLATGWWNWGWLIWALLLGLVLGVVADSIGSGHLINLLAPPLLMVVIWNIAVYILLLLHAIMSNPKSEAKPGLLVRLVQRIFRIGNSLPGVRSTDEPTRMLIVENFTTHWIKCSAPLSVARTTMLLHAVAAALGFGLIAGLYMRGLVFDYRAAWESTFLSANATHAILSVVLAPAIALSGISLPDEATFSAMRMVHGSNSTGVSAAPWIQLYSLTLLLIIVIPRSVLTLGYALQAYWLSRNMKLQFNEKYLARLSIQHKGDVPPASIVIGLVAHSNADKMTFFRKMLGSREAIKCEAHLVNEFQCVLPIIETHEEQLQLWNTPDFGESLRLVKRLQSTGKPFAWLLSDVWNRWRDSEFLHTQHGMCEVKDAADIILYLINAADKPETATFVQHEMDLLSWIGKPVIVLINQFDETREKEIKAAEIESWRVHLARHSHVKSVFSMDALTQCWMQEDRLFKTIEDLLVGERNLLMKRLRLSRRTQHIHTLDSVAHSIASSLSRLATHFEAVPVSGKFKSTLKQVGNSKNDQEITDEAQQSLSKNLEYEVRANTMELLALHDFETDNIGQMQMPDTARFDTRLHLDEDKVSIWSGIISGALTGLTADILSGGLTLGGGFIAGGLAGALGAKGLTHAVNVVRSTDRSGIEWNIEVLNQMLENALLRYLAVIHRDRGESSLVLDKSFAHWPKVIQHSLQPHRDALKRIWKLRESSAEGSNKAEKLITKSLEPIVVQSLIETLHALYPSAAPIKTL